MSAAQHTPILREIAGLQIHSGPGFALMDAFGSYRFLGPALLRIMPRNARIR
jgi:hypothetical protein